MLNFSVLLTDLLIRYQNPSLAGEQQYWFDQFLAQGPVPTFSVLLIKWQIHYKSLGSGAANLGLVRCIAQMQIKLFLANLVMCPM